MSSRSAGPDLPPDAWAPGIEGTDEWIKKHASPIRRRAHGGVAVAADRDGLGVGAGWPDERGIFKRITVDRIETFDSAPRRSLASADPPKTVADVDLEAFRREMAPRSRRPRGGPRACGPDRVLERELQTSARQRAPARRRTVRIRSSENHVKRLEAVFHGAEKLRSGRAGTARWSPWRPRRSRRCAPCGGVRGRPHALIRTQQRAHAREILRGDGRHGQPSSEPDDTGLGPASGRCSSARAAASGAALESQLGLLAGYAPAAARSDLLAPLHRAGLVDVRDDRVV